MFEAVALDIDNKNIRNVFINCIGYLYYEVNSYLELYRVYFWLQDIAGGGHYRMLVVELQHVVAKASF